jgi:hypothetical protein
LFLRSIGGGRRGGNVAIEEMDGYLALSQDVTTEGGEAGIVWRGT